MEGVQIVKVQNEEVDKLQRLSTQTFVETFAPYNSEADMQDYLTKSFNLITLKQELVNPNSQFYFAVLNTNPIGYLKVNMGPAQSDVNDASSLEIERIYVLKSYLGKKVGQGLFKKAFAIAKEFQKKYIWLGVWEKNERALEFYKKNGFVAFDKHVFNLGTDEQTDILMKLDL
jgi:GNAT superfamily N-acetyltransferase